jgi:hypothetical protein
MSGGWTLRNAPIREFAPASCPVRVKVRNIHLEQMLSALASISDIAARGRHAAFVPTADTVRNRTLPTHRETEFVAAII